MRNRQGVNNCFMVPVLAYFPDHLAQTLPLPVYTSAALCDRLTQEAAAVDVEQGAVDEDGGIAGQE